MAVFAYFYMQLLTTIRTVPAGGDPNPFKAGHILAGCFQILLELIIILFKNSLSVELGSFDLIQIVFHSSCEIHIEQVRKTAHQEVVDQEAQFAGSEVPFYKIHVPFLPYGG